MKLRVLWAALVSLLLLAGCRSAYYATWEKFGVYKRDLLKKKVVAARDDQKAASEQFKDALTRLKELYGFQGGDLEKAYSGIKRDYDKSVERADAVHQRIADVETVAGDLFKEWKEELGQISSDTLRRSSEEKLRETQARYQQLHTALKQAEKSMAPVLTRFHDQVLYLKHNLNAAAIASLKGESTSIQEEISRLLADMNAAISNADSFINSLP
jgi:membrane-bound lytic murein transglycosylase B